VVDGAWTILPCEGLGDAAPAASRAGTPREIRP